MVLLTYEHREDEKAMLMSGTVMRRTMGLLPLTSLERISAVTLMPPIRLPEERVLLAWELIGRNSGICLKPFSWRKRGRAIFSH